MNFRYVRPVLLFPIFFVSCWFAAAQPVVVTIGQNFTGVTYGSYNTNSGALPPDDNGAVGPIHYVEFINGMFAVYSKTNGRQLELKTDIDFWGAAGVGIDTSAWTVSDPRVIYDPASQRWFASQIDIDELTQILYMMLGANHFLLAVSETADPTGPWHGTSFDSDPVNGNFADFPTLGLDSRGVYLSGDMYDGISDPNAPTPLGPTLVSFPKADLLLPTPNFTNQTWFGIMDYAARGDVLQPAITSDGSNTGAVLAVIDIGNTTSPYSNLVSFAVQNAGGPGPATLGPATFVPITPYMVPTNAAVGAPLFTALQPDGTSDLQANDARLAAKVYTAGGVEYAVHNTLYNGRIAIRWYRLRASDNMLLESGTIAETNLDLFFPSIAANGQGTVLICFNASGSNTTVSAYAMAGLTMNGVTTFGNRILLKAGSISYHGDDEALGYPTSRWGDYSTTSVDPVDPTRFWTIQQFPIDVNVWATQITELRTTAPPHLDIVRATGNSITLSWPLAATGYQLQSATNLLAPVAWAIVTNSPATNGGQLVLSLPVSGTQRYFRLH
jgi:hypothetical protein